MGYKKSAQWDTGQEPGDRLFNISHSTTLANRYAAVCQFLLELMEPVT